MTSKQKTRGHDAATVDDRSRRDFVAFSAAAGLMAAAGPAAAGEPGIVEKDVEVATPDGHANAAFFHPVAGTHPGVLIWTDALGLRPVFRDFGRRLAAAGYSVLIPNPYYRTARSPDFGDVSAVDFNNAEFRAKLTQMMGTLSDSRLVDSDARAYIAFLDTQPQVNRASKIGTQGYCMGGRLVMITAAAVPDRVGAGASFHGGGLVTDKPDSPHLLAPKIKARLYIAIAASDDMQQPEAKDTLRSVFASAKVQAEIEVYAGSLHGWCVPDMPLRDGKPIYDAAQAERAWSKLSALYQVALA